MIELKGKTYRNLQEQVEENAKDIEANKKYHHVLNIYIKYNPIGSIYETFDFICKKDTPFTSITELKQFMLANNIYVLKPHYPLVSGGLPKYDVLTGLRLFLRSYTVYEFNAVFLYADPISEQNTNVMIKSKNVNLENTSGLEINLYSDTIVDY